MAIYRATVVFTDISGISGRSDWAVEAATEAQVRDLIISSLSRSGRILVGISVQQVTEPDRLHDPLFDGIGVSHFIREGRASADTPAPTGGVVPSESPVPSRSVGNAPWIPPALQDVLFVQAAPEDRVFAILEPMAWTGSAGTFADAADKAAVPAACLYDTESAGHGDGNAPWLVDLTASDAVGDRAPTMFHKRLFGRPEMLPKCVFLRAPMSLAEMRSGLRKLTRIRDLDDKWYYCRFWEPEFFLYLILFLEGRRLLSPLAGLRAFAVTVEDRIITSATDLRAAELAEPDRAGDLDLLFDAGVAMIALRRARALEREHGHGQRPYAVYTLARKRLSLRGMDYRFVEKCVDIAYSMRHFYGDRAIEVLDDDIVARCFDEHGDLRIFIEYLHGLSMFALIHNIAPHTLRSDAGFANVQF